MKLTELKWESLEGFGGGKIGRSYTNKPLTVGGKKYEDGLGVHASCVIVYDLPEGYERFQALGGLDNGGSDQGG